MQLLAGLEPTVDATLRFGIDARDRDPAALRAMLEPDVVDGCLACHTGALSLADRDVEVLVGMIDAMARGRAEHAVPVPRLSEADIQALAAALVEE